MSSKPFYFVFLTAMFGIVIFWPWLSNGDDLELFRNKDSPVKIKESKGDPLTIDWDDGRQAVFYLTVAENAQLVSLPFEVTANTCNEEIPKDCVLEYPGKLVELALRWTKNPQSEDRIGKTVEVISSVNESKDQVREFIKSARFLDGTSYVDKIGTPTGIPFPRIRCSNYKWLALDGETPLNKFTVDHWLAQKMAFNKETLASENLNYAGAWDVSFRHEGGDYIIYEHVAGYYSRSGHLFDPPESVSALIRKTPNGNFCQTTLQWDVEAAQGSAAVNKEESRISDTSADLNGVTTPLLYNPDPAWIFYNLKPGSLNNLVRTLAPSDATKIIKGNAQ